MNCLIPQRKLKKNFIGQRVVECKTRPSWNILNKLRKTKRLNNKKIIGTSSIYKEERKNT